MKSKDLTNMILGVSAATKSRAGFLIALACLLTIVEREALLNVALLHQYEIYVSVGVGVLGILLWLTGGIFEPREAEPVPEPAPSADLQAEQPLAYRPLAFLWSLKYWGVILVLSAAMLSCVFYYTRSKATPSPQVEVVRKVVTVMVTNVVTITNQTLPVVFPALELQGVVVNGAKSSAVLNGHVVCLGEALSNAVLVSVNSDYAVLEMRGKTKTLTLRRRAGRGRSKGRSALGGSAWSGDEACEGPAAQQRGLPPRTSTPFRPVGLRF